MREACCLWLSAADRARLAAIAADRNSPQKHVWRASIVLLSADRLGTVEIMRRTGKAKPSVWRWQARYLAPGSRGCCATRPGLRASRGSRPIWSSGWWPARWRRRRRGDALDGARDGRRGRHLARLGAADLGRARSAAAPGADLQALQGPGVRRQAARRGRALRRSAGAQPRAVAGREEPDPGARSDPTGTADEEGPGRDDDPRLQAPRHHDPVRRPQPAGRLGDRPMHGPPPPPGVHPLSQRGRGGAYPPAR